MRVAARGLGLKYGQRFVLENLDFDFNGPGIVGLVGPSGSGKTSLLNIINGSIKPDTGKIVVNGGPPGILTPAWVVQNSPLLLRRTALDNVRLGHLFRGSIVEGSESDISRTMDELGISQLKNQPVYTLSGGERQRVAVGRAVTFGGQLVLADEPTASLDNESRERVCDALVSAAVGALVVVATHDSYVMSRCGEILTLDAGRALL